MFALQNVRSATNLCRITTYTYRSVALNVCYNICFSKKTTELRSFSYCFNIKTCSTSFIKIISFSESSLFFMASILPDSLCTYVLVPCGRLNVFSGFVLKKHEETVIFRFVSEFHFLVLKIKLYGNVPHMFGLFTHVGS